MIKKLIVIELLTILISSTTISPKTDYYQAVIEVIYYDEMIVNQISGKGYEIRIASSIL